VFILFVVLFISLCFFSAFSLHESGLSKRAVILQEFEDNSCVMEVHVYLAESWSGDPHAASDEMKPQWWGCNQLPFDQMWKDDQHWSEDQYTTQMMNYMSLDIGIVRRIVHSCCSIFVASLLFHCCNVTHPTCLMLSVISCVCVRYPLLLSNQCFHAHFLFRGQEEIVRHTVVTLNDKERHCMQEEDQANQIIHETPTNIK